MVLFRCSHHYHYYNCINQGFVVALLYWCISVLLLSGAACITVSD